MFVPLSQSSALQEVSLWSFGRYWKKETVRPDPPPNFESRSLKSTINDKEVNSTDRWLLCSDELLNVAAGAFYQNRTLQKSE